jgi:putative transposase
MKRVLQQKLILSKSQESQLDSILESCKFFYNYLIATDKTHKDSSGKYLTKTELLRQCAVAKHTDPQFASIHSHLLQDVAKRLHLAKQAAWRRAKEKKMPFKYPRTKERFRTVWFKELNNGCKILSDNSISFNSIVLKFRKTKSIHNIKFIGITKKLSGYYVNLYYEDNVIFKFNTKCMNNYSNMVSEPKVQDKIVGVDFGCKTFLTFSDETIVKLPKKLFDIGKYIDYLNVMKSKKQEGSGRYKKLQLKIAKLHDMIARIREDFLHKISKYILQKYETVVFEALDIENLVYNNFSGINRKIYNSGFGTLIRYLLYKVENTGKQIVQVNPAYTSQTCWKCYNIEKKELHEREHICKKCGERIDRDLNAARVIRDVWIKKIDLGKLKARKELSKGEKNIPIENPSPNYVW